jgi:hypothetical protein
MVQFPGCLLAHLCIQCAMARRLTRRVTPFGYPGISGCVLLPPASRSLPRPSSDSSSKASTMNPFSLDHIFHRSSFPRPVIGRGDSRTPQPHRSGTMGSASRNLSARCEVSLPRCSRGVSPHPLGANQRIQCLRSPFPGVVKEQRYAHAYLVRFVAATPLVGLVRVELTTSRLSGVRSNHLSYRPRCWESPAAARRPAALPLPRVVRHIYRKGGEFERERAVWRPAFACR